MKAVPCEVYSRVVGYFRPVNNWNQGKKQEFDERVAFTEKHSLKDPKIQESESLATESSSASPIDSYKIFTFPNCDKCEQVKEILKTKNLAGQIVDLKSPEGNKEFRRYYSDRSIKNTIKRTEDGTLKLPVVLFMNQDKVVSTAQDLQETQSILA